MTTRYTPQGAAVLDDVVVCAESVTIDSTTYYRGRLSQLPQDSVLGITSADYGAWSAVSKGGTRFRVDVFPAVPSDSNTGTGSPPDLVVDFSDGAVYSTVNQTVYFRYVGHGSYFVAPPVLIPVFLAGILPTGTSNQDWGVATVWQTTEITHYNIEVPPHMFPPAASVAMSLRDALAGGGNAASGGLVIGSGLFRSGWTAFGATFRVEAGGLLVVRGDGKNMENGTVWLRGNLR